MRTWHIHIEGQVQGLGFRPFVFLLAERMGLKGWVNNGADGVHVEFNAEEALAERFYEDLIREAPALARITQHSMQAIPLKAFNRFSIVHSKAEASPRLLLTPDFALCDACRRDLRTEGNRRHDYAFTTCTQCGPRYSIIHQLPYDRESTTMDTFPMCPACQAEYDNPRDRRYYSQTNSCSDCGIQLSLYNATGMKEEVAAKELIQQVVALWSAGQIVAIKGIGGYLLTCDASHAETLARLRERKHRPSKAFALMFPDLETLEEVADVGKKATQALQSEVAPIVILPLKAAAETDLCLDQIAPGLQQVGAMLPYTPLFQLLLQQFARPIVATSGNLSNSPIVFEEEKALNELFAIADYLLSDNRKIVTPQDDSVIRFSPFTQQKVVLRRSRGLAPSLIHPAINWSKQSLLAAGAQLKSSFGLVHQGNTYISQYLGDLSAFDTQESYQHSLRHLLRLFQIKPRLTLLCDKHPDYAATQNALHLAQLLDSPIHQIQHHEAHFAAVLGEQDLVHAKEPILGVIWDGTGLGNDRQIWGGEFFQYQLYQFIRIGHFDYFDAILGDKMPREPRISALSACWGHPELSALLKDKFSSTEWRIYTRMLERKNPLQTSSVGRLFDAVASLLGLMDQQSYEGEAAMLLEQLATSYCRSTGLDFTATYLEDTLVGEAIPTDLLLQSLIEDIRQQKPAGWIAAKFHYTLVKIILQKAEQHQVRHIACSGGVFQNGLLLDLLRYHAPPFIQLHFHEQLSPNDENIAFGQLVHWQIAQHRSSFSKNKTNNHVFSDSR
ncbi:MAG: carbamoyltransferase HypF [Bacteroidota bacterium]